VLANIHRDPKKPAFKVSDFMPSVRKKQTPDEMIKTLELWNLTLQGKNE